MKEKKKKILRSSMPKAERINFLLFVKAIDKYGKDPSVAVLSKIEEYEERKKKKLRKLMESIQISLSGGNRFIEALYDNSVITLQEYYILLNSKDGLASGIDKIITDGKKSGKITLGLMMFLAPIIALATALLVFHGAVKDIVIGVTAPMREAGATPPPIPEYLIDPKMYILVNIMIWVIIIGTWLFMKMLKKSNPSLYLKSLPILEEEFSIDVLYSLKTLMSGGGMNLAMAAKALLAGADDSIKKDLYANIVSKTTDGSTELSKIMANYGVRYSTLASLRLGEKSNDIVEGIDMAVEFLEEKYNRDIAIFLRVAFWGGQFGMMGIAMKPMVDILMLMSVGQMNFEL